MSSATGAAAMRPRRHQPPAPRQRGERLGPDVGIGDVLIDDVDAASFGDPHDLFREIEAAVIDAMIGAEFDADRNALIRTGAGDDVGAQQLGDLDAEGAKPAGGAKPAEGAHDEHPFAFLEPGAVLEKPEGGRGVPRNGAGLGEGEVIGKGDGRGGRDLDEFRVAARAVDADGLRTLAI